MPKAMKASLRTSPRPDLTSGPEDDATGMASALSALAEINTRYERDLAALEEWTGPNRIKDRLIRELHGRYQQRRQPHVRRLEELHQRATNVTMFRSLRTLH